MRIAHVLSHVSAKHAGVPIATRKMAQALQRLGVSISFWTTGYNSDKDDLAAEGILAHVFDRSWLHEWRYAPGLAKALARSSDDIDLLHIHEIWTYPQLAAAKVGAKTGIPYLWAPRASLEPWRMRYKGRKKKLYFSLLVSGIMKKAACMHAVSTAEVEGFRLLGFRGPVTIVPNGISVEEFKILPDPSVAESIWPELAGRRVVLFLSRLSREKGLDQLLPGWADLIKKDAYNDALLVLAGPDDRNYSLKVMEMIKMLGIEANVLLTGMVEGRNKLALISRANIYTLPSYSEGFSNSLLENLAAGKPVLITPGCNFPEVTKVGSGLCVEPQRDALGEGLKRLLDMSKDKLNDMGNNGRRLVMENFTWDIAARKLVTVYDAILNEKEIPLHPEPVFINSKVKEFC